MNKSELIAAMAESADISNAAAGKALDGMIGVVSAALSKGDSVALTGFGKFSVAKRAARDGRNPQTGETIKIAAKKVAKFKVGATLAEAVK